MNALLTFMALAICLCLLIFLPAFVPPEYTASYGVFTVFDSARALSICAILSLGVGILLFSVEVDGVFLLRLFIMGLLIRMLIAAVIFATNTQSFFGGD